MGLPSEGGSGSARMAVGGSVSLATFSVTSALVSWPEVSRATAPTVGGCPFEMIGAQTVNTCRASRLSGWPPAGITPCRMPPDKPSSPTIPSSSPTVTSTWTSSPSLYGLPAAGARTVTVGGMSCTTCTAIARSAESPLGSLATARKVSSVPAREAGTGTCQSKTR